MQEFFSWLFDRTSFEPHGICLLWRVDLVWAQAAADSLIALSYFSIPVGLIAVVMKRRDLIFPWLFVLFGAFILLCGMTHVMDTVTFWVPLYGLQTSIKILTAVASVSSAIVLWSFIPRILALPDVRKIGEGIAARRMAEETAHLKAIMNTVLDGLITINSRGLIQSFNPAAIRIFGYEPHEVIGQNVKMLMPEPYHGGHDDYLRNYMTSGNAKVIGIGREVSARRKDGSIFPMELGVNEMTVEGGERMFVGTIRDISERKEAEREVRQSQERYQALIAASEQVIWTWQQGVLDKTSPLAEWWETTTGQPSEAITTLGWLEVVHPDDRDGVKKIWEDAIAERKNFEMEYRLRARDGKYLHVAIRGVALLAADGSVHEFIGSLNDITKRKEAEEKTSRLAAIVEFSDDAIISKSLDSVIQSWNDGAERLFGYRADEAIGQHISLLIPPDRMDEDREIIAKIYAGKSVSHFDTVRKTKDGRLIDISLSVSPIRDASGKIIGASKVARDITDRKRIEAQLLRYTKELERSNQELDDFAYIASHDLKEPLRGLYNHASFLLEDYSTKLDEDGARRLNRLTDLAQRMERLVNDLLYFSRLGRGDMAVQPTDLNEVIADIERIIESSLKERNAQIVLPKKLPIITCDRPRITEVFRNLITNAAKYNNKPERIIEVGYIEKLQTPKGAEENIFYVKDNGVGIAPEFYNEIFRIFRRLQSPTGDKEEGTGVGLTFVKKIIERHNGRIWLESIPGIGTTFISPSAGE